MLFRVVLTLVVSPTFAYPGGVDSVAAGVEHLTLTQPFGVAETSTGGICNQANACAHDKNAAPDCEVTCGNPVCCYNDACVPNLKDARCICDNWQYPCSEPSDSRLFVDTLSGAEKAKLTTELEAPGSMKACKKAAEAMGPTLAGKTATKFFARLFLQCPSMPKGDKLKASMKGILTKTLKTCINSPADFAITNVPTTLSGASSKVISAVCKNTVGTLTVDPTSKMVNGISVNALKAVCSTILTDIFKSFSKGSSGECDEEKDDDGEEDGEDGEGGDEADASEIDDAANDAAIDGAEDVTADAAEEVAVDAAPEVGEVLLEVLPLLFL